MRKRALKFLLLDKEFTKIHDKLYQVVGPLSSAWNNLQTVVNDDGENIDPGEVLKNINEAVVLLGQTIKIK